MHFLLFACAIATLYSTTLPTSNVGVFLMLTSAAGSPKATCGPWYYGRSRHATKPSRNKAQTQRRAGEGLAQYPSCSTPEDSGHRRQVCEQTEKSSYAITASLKRAYSRAYLS